MCLPRDQEPITADNANILFPDFVHMDGLLDIPQIIVSPPSPPVLRLQSAPPTIDEVSLLLEEVPQLVNLVDNVPPIYIEGDYTEADLQQMEPELAHEHRLRLNRIQTFNDLMSDTRNRLRLIQGILRPYTRRSNPSSI